MGFFLHDLFVQRIPKFVWHDKLTNPPTVPETSPIIHVAALSPRFTATQAGGRGGGAALPADDQTLIDIPTPLTPIVTPADRLTPADLVGVREVLITTLKVVDKEIAAAQATPEDIAHVAEVARG